MRTWIANKLINLARRIDPPNKLYLQFLQDQMVDFILTGQSTIKVSSVDSSELFTVRQTVAEE